MQPDQWFVVVANSQRESFVEDRLKAIEPYCPRFKTPKGTIRPVFPSYLFVPAVEKWSWIKNTVGVRDLIMAGDHPAMLPGKVIVSWKAKERGGLVQLPPPPRFRIGERLTILRGSLKWRSVIYAGMSGKDRERVLIEMLGGQVTLTVPTQDLVSESERSPRNSLPRRPETVYGRRTRRFLHDDARPVVRSL